MIGTVTRALADAMVIATFLGALVFVIAYLHRNWRSTAIGRNVMALMAIIAIVSALAVSSIVFGHNWPARDLIRALAWGSVAGAVWWRVVLLWHTPGRTAPAMLVAPTTAVPTDPTAGVPPAVDHDERPAMLYKYGKTVAAALFAFITAIQAYISDGHVTPQEGVQIAIAAATVVSVWLVPILHYPWMKTAMAALLGGLNAAVTLIVGGIDTGDVTIIVLAALSVLAVGVSPAESDMPARARTPLRRPGGVV